MKKKSVYSQHGSAELQNGGTVGQAEGRAKEFVKQMPERLIGSNIRRLRAEKNLRSCDVICSLQLLGVDINSSTLSKIENGYGNPSVELLKGLAEVYHCSYDEFFQDGQ